jgi:hypothetical protein
MKKCIFFCLGLLILFTPLSFCFAGDSEEDHICFTRIDSDHDDSATFEEFKKFYGDELEKFKKIDQDDDGKLTHDEYEEYLLDQEE